MIKQIYILCILLLICFSCKPEDSDNDIYNSTPYKQEDIYRFPDLYVPNSNLLTQAKVDLGRKLYYDPILSRSGNMSCATCHNMEYSFVDNHVVLSTNDLGMVNKRNTSTLINLGFSNKLFFWNGRAISIEAAVEDAVLNEQHPNWNVAFEALKNNEEYKYDFAKAYKNALINHENIINSIASFLRIIISKDSKLDLMFRGQATLTPLEQFGLDSVFNSERGDCFHCHGVYPFMTDNDFHDNGLQQNVTNINTYTDLGLGEVTGNDFDNGKMKTPTLRNLEYTAPYMHDGRFNTLNEVINFYSENLNQTPNVDPLMKKVNQGGLHLTPYEKSALKAFLLTLTDTLVLSNTDLENPF